MINRGSFFNISEIADTLAFFTKPTHLFSQGLFFFGWVKTYQILSVLGWKIDLPAILRFTRATMPWQPGFWGFFLAVEHPMAVTKAVKISGPQRLGGEKPRTNKATNSWGQKVVEFVVNIMVIYAYLRMIYRFIDDYERFRLVNSGFQWFTVVNSG